MPLCDYISESNKQASREHRSTKFDLPGDLITFDIMTV